MKNNLHLSATDGVYYFYEGDNEYVSPLQRAICTSDKVLAKESANFFARKGLKITRTSEKGSSLVLQFGSSTTYLCNEIGKITEKCRFLEKSFDFGLTINKQFRILEESWKSCQQVSPRNRRFGGQPTPRRVTSPRNPRFGGQPPTHIKSGIILAPATADSTYNN